MLTRRRALAGFGSLAVAAGIRQAAGSPAADALRFGLTPVLLTNDLELLDRLEAYLRASTNIPVELVTRRTYQEITGLLISGQLHGAWICSPPFLAYREQLDLLAVPVWNGQPLYRSYLIADATRSVDRIDDMAGDVHAFSDPDSNSGFLATAAELARRGFRPERFFSRAFFTYGHRNVVRAVAAGLAQSGSVDGYVYEVLKDVEPRLTDGIRVVQTSPWYGFPPVAGPASLAGSEVMKRLQRALLTMHEDAAGRDVLKMLRLDSFSQQPASLFDPVAANMKLVRGLA
jgi:phosphonate transport system substrate-binding protein